MRVDIDLSDRVVVVTGAAGTLGSAVASAFTAAGTRTIGTDVVGIDADQSKVVAEDIHTFVQADLTDPEEARSVFATVEEEYGTLDTLANIAGTWRGGNPIEDTSLETYQAVMDFNLKTMFLSAKYALPLLQGSEGSIVSVSARASLTGGTGDGPYRAAKAGVRLLTETIAEENKGTVRANAVMPSIIDTPMNREMMPEADHGQWVAPSAIADVILWLSSEGSRVTSGAAIPVYGSA